MIFPSPGFVIFIMTRGVGGRQGESWVLFGFRFAVVIEVNDRERGKDERGRKDDIDFSWASLSKMGYLL